MKSFFDFFLCFLILSFNFLFFKKFMMMLGVKVFLLYLMMVLMFLYVFGMVLSSMIILYYSNILFLVLVMFRINLLKVLKLLFKFLDELNLSLKNFFSSNYLFGGDLIK